MERKKRKYPKNRKKRNTSYSKTYKVLTAIGEENLYEIWKERGHIETAAIVTKMLGFHIDRMVIHYIALRKLKWKRIITDKNNPLYKSVLSGKVSPEHYKTIIFQ